MLQYKMKTETIVMCVVALILGMLLANMLKSVCGCKTVEGLENMSSPQQLALFVLKTQNNPENFCIDDSGSISDKCEGKKKLSEYLPKDYKNMNLEDLSVTVTHQRDY